jgi:hypothetical protein
LTAQHLEVLVEEPSMEAFLRELLPRILSRGRSFEVYPFQGKSDLLGRLPDRLRAYSQWLPDDWRIVVVVDRDDDDCLALKQRLEKASADAGLATRTRPERGRWQLVNRIAIEELESWYFGDWEAVRTIYQRVPATVPRRAGFRAPDAIAGGTWEAFERILQRHGYFEGGLRKIEAARRMGRILDPQRCSSPSFVRFRQAILEATA